MDSGIELDGVGCVRGGRTLFAGVSMRLAPGDCLVVRGPNGSGKSTLLRMIAGLLTPSEGAIERRGAIGFAHGRPALDPHRTLGAALADWARLDAGDAARGCDAMGLARLMDVPVRWLSSGQVQRANLARVIASGAPIWLLDEPSTALDVQACGLLADALALHRGAGGIAVVATHDALQPPGAQTLRLGA